MKRLKGDVIKIANSLNKRISESDIIFNTNDWNKQRELVTDIVIEVTGLNEIDDNDEICLLVNSLCEKYNIGISKDDLDINDFSEEDTEDYECSLEMYEYVFNEVKKYAEEDGIDLTDIDEEQLSEYCSAACDNNDFNSTDIVEDTEFSVFQKMKIDLGLAEEDDLICSDDEYDSLVEFIENYAEENGIDLKECSGSEFRDIVNLACENLNIDINSKLEGSIDYIFDKLVEDYDIVIDDTDDFPEMKSYELKEWIENHDEITPEVLNDALNNFEKLSRFDYDPSEYERRMYELGEYYEIDEDTIAEYLE